MPNDIEPRALTGAAAEVLAIEAGNEHAKVTNGPVVAEFARFITEWAAQSRVSDAVFADELRNALDWFAIAAAAGATQELMAELRDLQA